jgi:AcrR family transcriptional regulator
MKAPHGKGRSMSADLPAPGPPRAGLRERKKARTRAEIRAQGLRLFREQGYHQTTTEQIAAAADISPATFFRYFPTKERVVLSEDLESTMLAALAAQSTDLPVLTALQRAIRHGLAQLERHDEQERRELIAAVPELRAARLDDIRRTIELLARAIAERLGRPAGDFEIRIFTGALTGTVMAALGDDRTDDQDPAKLDNIRQAIDYLGTGFPLTARIPGQPPAQQEHDHQSAHGDDATENSIIGASRAQEVE